MYIYALVSLYFCSVTSAPATLTQLSNTTCGVYKGNQTNNICASNLCCSSTGLCGATIDYCGAGCQSGFGLCQSTGGVNLNPLRVTIDCSDTSSCPLTYEEFLNIIVDFDGLVRNIVILFTNPAVLKLCMTIFYLR